MKKKTTAPPTAAMRTLYVRELKRIQKNLAEARKQVLVDQKDVAELLVEVAELTKLKRLAKSVSVRQTMADILADRRDDLASCKEDLKFSKQDVVDIQNKFDSLVG